MINKKWKKDASDNAVNALMRVGGAAVASMVLKKVTDASFTSQSNVNKTIGNIASPILSLVALAGDIFLDSPALRGVCQGVYSYSIPKTVATIAPAIGEYMALNGAPAPLILNGTPGIMNGTPAIANTAQKPAIPPKTYTAEPSAEVQADRLAGTMIAN